MPLIRHYHRHFVQVYCLYYEVVSGNVNERQKVMVMNGIRIYYCIAYLLENTFDRKRFPLNPNSNPKAQ